MTPVEPRSDAVQVSIRRGSLYVSVSVYERYFAGLDAVILLRRDDDLHIMPVRNTAGGGYLLKLRNTSGDRIVDAMDFFRGHGLDEFTEYSFEVRWNSDLSALTAQNAFKSAN